MEGAWRVRALVTGGAGFIGSAIAKKLLEEGHQVRILDNFLTGSRDAIPDGADLLEGDLRDARACGSACRDMEVVFHQGAARSVPRSIDEPLLVQQCNVEGTLNLLTAAENAGVRRLIFASSSSIYGEAGGGETREDAIPDPRSPYAASKIAAEYYCRVWTHLGKCQAVSLRYFNVFGPGQSLESKYAAIFPAFCKALLAGEAPQVHWDGEQSRDFTYIDDVVVANMSAATAGPEVDGTVINIAGGHPRSVNEVLSAVSQIVGRWIDPGMSPKRPGDIRHTWADIGKAKGLLGWEPVADWQESVKATVAWFARSSP